VWQIDIPLIKAWRSILKLGSSAIVVGTRWERFGDLAAVDRGWCERKNQ
jgi:hypothetical protein